MVGEKKLILVLEHNLNSLDSVVMIQNLSTVR